MSSDRAPSDALAPSARVSRLRVRLDALRSAAHRLAARAPPRDRESVVIDAASVVASRALHDAYVRAVKRDAEDALATIRVANRARARRLAADARDVATRVRGFGFGSIAAPCAWNFPRGAMSAVRARRGEKLRVLRRVEARARRARARTVGEDARAVDEDVAREEENESSGVDSDEGEAMYACAEVLYPRRAMARCRALVSLADAEREKFNADHAAALERRREIVDRLRSIDRRVTMARRSMREIDSRELDAREAEEADALVEWWDAESTRAAIVGDDDVGTFHPASILRESEEDRADGADASGRADGLVPTSSSATTLRAMMGEDILDDAGRVDAEACDKRQGFDGAAIADARVERPEFIDSDDERGELNDEELRKARSLTREQHARLVEYKSALLARRRANEEHRAALRGEIRRLIQEASELTTTFNERVRGLALERREAAFRIVLYEWRSARVARRLFERRVAGDFDGQADAEARDARLARERVSRAEEVARRYASEVERTKVDLNAATLAARAALKSFRRDAQDNPASRVHLDALVALYQHPDAIARTTDEASDGRLAFPQGLDDRWWDKLAAARVRRVGLERELTSAREAHAKSTARARELDLEVERARNDARDIEDARAAARRARRARAYDADVRVECSRGVAEFPLARAVEIIERDDAIVVPKSRIDALNASLRASHAAKTRAEAARATARDDIARARWEIRVLALAAADVAARSTEVALLRVSKRLQRFLYFHDDDDESTSARSAALAARREDVSEAAALAGRVDRNARSHAQRVSRATRELDHLRRRERQLTRMMHLTDAQIAGSDRDDDL